MTGLDLYSYCLASETQRPEADLIEGALSSYLNNDAQYANILRQRMKSADRVNSPASRKSARSLHDG